MPYKRKLSGIYLITNWATGQSYVGSSTAVQDRLANHKALLRAGQGHHNKHLQASFTKYGEDQFGFELLELCPEHRLEEREKYWIQGYDAVNSGFNTSLDVKCPARGRKQTKEEIVRRAQACCKLRKFVDPNGQVFETANTKAFAEKHGISYSGITAVANGKKFACHGWRRYASELEHQVYIDPRLGRPNEKLAKEYQLVTPAGDQVTVKNLSKFCKQHGLSVGNLFQVIHGERAYHKGFRRVP